MIIINLVLKINVLLPFQLMSSNIREINAIIQDDFDLVINKSYLRNANRKEFDNFENNMNSFYHAKDLSEVVLSFKI